MDDGSTKEEWKMSVETNKILDKNIQVTAHCVRVPVFIGHSEAIFIECEKEINEAKARNILNMSATPGQPEKVDWRFRSNFNSTGNEFWSKSTNWINKPE